MKTLSRILIILLAALSVIGATYAFSQTTVFSALVGQPVGEGELEGRSGPPDFANGQGAPADESGLRREGGPEGRGGSWETVGRNLLEIAVIVAAVQVLWSIGRWLKRTATSLTRKNRLDPSRS
jgi:hypothetical protein